MPWAKIDDMLHSHPKVAQAGLEAMGLFVVGLSWSACYLTDGFIPDYQLPRFGNGNLEAIADRLVTAGLWHKVEDGYNIHDYLNYNPSGEKVKAERSANAKRQSAWRDKKNTNAVSNGVSNGVSNAVSASAPSPSPSPSPIPVPEPELGASAPSEPPQSETPDDDPLGMVADSIALRANPPPRQSEAEILAGNAMASAKARARIANEPWRECGGGHSELKPRLGIVRPPGVLLFETRPPRLPWFPGAQIFAFPHESTPTRRCFFRTLTYHQ